MNGNTIIITKDGKEEEGNILFTHYSEEHDRNYVIFELGDAVTAACYDPTSGTGGELSDIETEEEWEMIEDLLENFYDSIDEAEE